MRHFASIILILLSLSCASAPSTGNGLTISHLSGDCYIFTSYNTYQGELIPANGMYLVTREGVVLFDTPWDSTQFQPLLDSIKRKHNKRVLLCLATDFHEDRSGGLEYYRSKGIRTYTTRAIDMLSKKKGMKRAEFLINRDTTFKVGSYSFQTYFPGAGHTAVNTVIWLPEERILYGGCLIKSTEDEDLGYLGDANVHDYAATVKNVRKRCPAPRFVIPGHGNWQDTGSVTHTLLMAERLKRDKRKP